MKRIPKIKTEILLLILHLMSYGEFVSNCSECKIMNIFSLNRDVFLGGISVAISCIRFRPCDSFLQLTI